MRALAHVAGNVMLTLLVTAVAVSRSFAQRTFTLVEELRIGGAQSGPTSLSFIRAVAVAPDGNIFLVDNVGGPQIKVFDGAGKFVKSAGRMGGGPGEYRFVSAMLRGPDGNIHVVDPQGMRVLVFGAGGELVEQRSVRFRSITREWAGTIAADGALLDPIFAVSAPAAPAGSSTTLLRRIRPDGSVADTIPFPECRPVRQPARTTFRFDQANGVTMTRIPFLATAQTVFSPDGSAWCSPRDEYHMVRTRVGSHDTLAVVRQNLPPIPVPRDSLEKTLAGYASAAAKSSRSDYDPALVPRTLPLIAAIDVDDQGRLWVRRTDTPALSPRFDLYDSDGRQIGVVQGRGRIRGIPHVVGNTAYTIVLDDDDVPFLVKAAIR